MGAVRFGMKLFQLYAGLDSKPLQPHPGDHAKTYAGKQIPLTITFSCTARCNLNCAHCQAQNSNQTKDLDTSRALKLIDEAAAAGDDDIHVAHGTGRGRKVTVMADEARAKEAKFGVGAVGLVLAAVALLAFVFQNTAETQFRWLVFEVTMPRWAALVIAAVLGAVIANLGGWMWRRRS